MTDQPPAEAFSHLNIEWPENPMDVRVLSRKETAAMIGIGTTTLERIEADKENAFPAVIHITEGRRGYLAHEVAAWIKARAQR